MPTMTTDAAPRAPRSNTERNTAALILCGGLTRPPLAEALGAPLLTLPQTPRQSVFDGWLEAFDRAGISLERCRLLTDSADGCHGHLDRGGVEILSDTGPYRGPAGVVRDAVDRLDLSGCCLIIENSRMLTNVDALGGLIRSHRTHEKVITVSINPDGSFSGLIAADADAVRLIPGIGFIDIKEQWLPAASREGFEIVLHELASPCLSIRTATSYIEALRRTGWFEHRGDHTIIGRGSSSLFGEPYGGSLVADSADIAPDAVVSCSAVADGARIESGAIVVRSIVGPGARVKKDELIIDTVVPTSDDQT